MNGNFLPRLNAALALALCVLYCAWWLAAGAPMQALPVAALLLAILPLAALAPFLWRGQRFSVALAGLILPFHFAFAVMELIANPEVRLWVAVQTFLTFLLFALVMASLRQVRTA